MDHRIFFINDELRDNRKASHVPLDRYLNLVGFMPWKIKPDDYTEDSILGNCFFMENFGGQNFFVEVNELDFSVTCQAYGRKIHSEKFQIETEYGVMTTLAALGFPNPEMFTTLD